MRAENTPSSLAPLLKHGDSPQTYWQCLNKPIMSKISFLWFYQMKICILYTGTYNQSRLRKFLSLTSAFRTTLFLAWQSEFNWFTIVNPIGRPIWCCLSLYSAILLNGLYAVQKCENHCKESLFRNHWVPFLIWGYRSIWAVLASWIWRLGRNDFSTNIWPFERNVPFFLHNFSPLHSKYPLHMEHFS